MPVRGAACPRRPSQHKGATSSRWFPSDLCRVTAGMMSGASCRPGRGTAHHVASGRPLSLPVAASFVETGYPGPPGSWDPGRRRGRAPGAPEGRRTRERPRSDPVFTGLYPAASGGDRSPPLPQTRRGSAPVFPLGVSALQAMPAGLQGLGSGDVQQVVA